MRTSVELVPKSWGAEWIFLNDSEANLCGKLMVAQPTGKSRIERHRVKDETFFILDGIIMLELFGHGEEPEPEDIIYLRAGESYRLRPGHWHRFGASEKECRFVEVSSFHSDLDTDRRPK